MLGPNGAGKTTTVRILTTLLDPDAGRGEVAGLDVVRDAERLRTIGLAGQNAAVDENLTGRENLEMVGRLYHLGSTRPGARRRDARAVRLATRPTAPSRRTRAGCAAGSTWARAWWPPAVLFLDEPTTGLDPRAGSDLWDVIGELVAEGTTLLLTTQYLEEAEVLADRIVVIDGGRVIAEGTSDELKAHVGGDVVELRLADREPSAARPSGLLRARAGGDQRRQREREIRVPVRRRAPT